MSLLDKEEREDVTECTYPNSFRGRRLPYQVLLTELDGGDSLRGELSKLAGQQYFATPRKTSRYRTRFYIWNKDSIYFPRSGNCR
jgi:hypothetical protein